MSTQQVLTQHKYITEQLARGLYLLQGYSTPCCKSIANQTILFDG